MLAEEETSDTAVEAVKSDPRSSWLGCSRRVDADVGDENTESHGTLQPLRIPSVITPERRTFVVIVR